MDQFIASWFTTKQIWLCSLRLSCLCGVSMSMGAIVEQWIVLYQAPDHPEVPSQSRLSSRRLRHLEFHSERCYIGPLRNTMMCPIHPIRLRFTP
ncbi:hypothetical protein BKA59DRAFT_483419 [Fusarium tricinctum]|uniref:Uncharacterized protein n=1 Tax=Fusarium tricinctum TaxID=61284 RepID=A0A8K0RNM1_9HYPO|nr:hypothetical protein BKA59DRAFT_483419 [Fusarium tricinctum]